MLVDGGTDILMRGDEAGLGTPEEDITSLAAVASLEVPTKLVCCLGFGIDAYHGVNHVQVLENLAALDRAGGYQAATPLRPSIVNGQIAAASHGECGDVQFTRRTGGSSLFVNPLMAIYFTVELGALARRCLYLDRLANTVGMRQVSMRIEEFRNEFTPRIPRGYPH